MSLYESGNSNGQVSLSQLFKGVNPKVADTGTSITAITDLVCKGGWPSVQELEVSKARTAMKAYVEELTGMAIRRATGVAYNKQNVLKTLKSLARNVGTRVSESKIAVESGTEGNPVDRKTVANYLQALERVMIIENNPPWSPNLRSPLRLTALPVRFFIDPSIAVAALGATPTQLLGPQIKLLGFLFENLVARDVRVYAQSMGGRVLQYRDETGGEIDLIIESGDGTWAAIYRIIWRAFIHGSNYCKGVCVQTCRWSLRNPDFNFGPMNEPG
jgi:predicted AAA+ superfamily ATPase